MKTTLMISLCLLTVGLAFVPSAEAVSCEEIPSQPGQVPSYAAHCVHEVEHAVLCLVDPSFCL